MPAKLPDKGIVKFSWGHLYSFNPFFMISDWFILNLPSVHGESLNYVGTNFDLPFSDVTTLDNVITLKYVSSSSIGVNPLLKLDNRIAKSKFLDVRLT